MAVRRAVPELVEGVQFPTKDAEAWNQASRARYLEFDTVENAQIQSDAAAKLMDKIGPSVALTNSAGGMRAILTALKTNNLVGIVMYENVGYVYPQGEGPGGPVGGFGPIEVPLEEFRKLTKIPMQMVWGDNVDNRPALRTASTVEALRRKDQQVRRQGSGVDAARRRPQGQHAHPLRGYEQRCRGGPALEISLRNGLDKR
jgi:hypothetical protein